MILEFSVENFFSFKERVSFSMLANATKGLEENYVNSLDKDILKSAVIYGANASGKSNLFKILLSVGMMIGQSTNFNVNDKLPIEPFEFTSQNDLSSFEIKFIKNEKKYVYGFSANRDEIVEEYLYYYPNGREAKIFDRTNINDYTFSPIENKSLSMIKDKTAKNKFFLSVATNWNSSLTKPAFDFLSQDIGFCFDTDELRNVALSIYKSDDGTLKKFALDFLKKADFNINDFQVDEIEIPDSMIPEALRNIPNIPKKMFTTTFIHNINGIDYKLDYNDESLGTQLTFIILPFISLALEQKRILIIDELDKSMHPYLVQLIIEMFNNPDININGAQLIFNTHDTNLLNLRIFRRDQIWFTEKNPDTGISDLYSLSDFSVRNNENIEKGYLNGKYGAIPFINTDINLWQED